MAPSLSGHFGDEDGAVEQPAMELLEELGWATGNLFEEPLGPDTPNGRTSYRQWHLPNRLRAALARLNPGVPQEALQGAEERLIEDRQAMSPAAGNRAFLTLLWEGVKVELRNEEGGFDTETVKVIDWVDVGANDFFAANQVWMDAPPYLRRPDTIGFVNGLPLLVAEWKGITKPLASAYQDNLRDYRDAIPRLFEANGIVILSNGLEAVLGASHAPFEFFSPWKRLTEEGEESVSLETLLRGTCEPSRFLDLIENFVLFEDGRDGLIKKIGRYHQVLGVNRAVRAVEDIGDNAGRLGVFWHTQGSGKSLSMVMFAEKVLRRLGGNYTFVVITDRTELDDQIAATFAATGALTRDIKHAQASSRANLRELLAGNERYVFTLIQKFGTDDQEAMPVLSDRSDIIVITDEAHRSQYDQLAANMRAALPNAAFIGFTGTPLIKGEDSKTREVFGDYVSIYDFAQSVRDGATVPLFYESRKPELQMDADALRDELDHLLEEAELDEEQEKRLNREFANQYQLITREDRLDKIAEDLALHISTRGYRGKAMFVAIDKATAVRMHGKVQDAMQRLITKQEAKLRTAGEAEGAAIFDQLEWMRSLDMAVVVSQAQNEVDDMRQKGLDIAPHRERMQREDLEAKFKDPGDKLQLVFVCAMWITGFDVPSISTIYLDKPMKNHTLMQTIARANRKAAGKTSGVIVDYVGVFQNLQKALAVYAGAGDGKGGDANPIADKGALVDALEERLKEASAYCQPFGVDPSAILASEKLARNELIAKAVDLLVAPDERRREFLRLSSAVVRAYKAVLPDERAAPFMAKVSTFHVVSEAVWAKLGPADISAISERIAELLDEKIEGVAILAPIIEGDNAGEGRVDLSGIDFEKLAKLFETKPRTAAQRLREAAENQVSRMVAQNPMRKALVEKLEELVAAYNAGSIDAEKFFEWLKRFVDELDEEQARGAREGLDEAELAIFDLLTKPAPKLTKAQEIEVKKVARRLLGKLEDLVEAIDWVSKRQARAEVHSAIRVHLNALPEEPYPMEIWEQKVDGVWQFVLAQYAQSRGPSA